MSGTLYLCATPIGNLEDITLRVLRVLREADLIAAEDTRTSGVLLSHFDIHTPLTSYHKFNEEDKAPELVGRLLSGVNIALITDAGTPAISDPGEHLVRLCIESGVPVTSLPGPSAVITALTISGLSTRRFVFEGFLPADRKERAERLAALRNEDRTAVIYEAPHRLKKTLAELADQVGADRPLAMTRELTKKFETVVRGTVAECLRDTEVHEPRGEYVLILGGRPGEELAQEKAAAWENMSVADHVAMYEEQGLPRKEAMRRAAADRGTSRREIYQALLGE